MSLWHYAQRWMLKHRLSCCAALFQAVGHLSVKIEVNYNHFNTSSLSGHDEQKWHVQWPVLIFKKVAWGAFKEPNFKLQELFLQDLNGSFCVLLSVLSLRPEDYANQERSNARAPHPQTRSRQWKDKSSTTIYHRGQLTGQHCHIQHYIEPI